MMKRTLSMILVLCMVAALFAGCGGNKLEVAAPAATQAATQAPAVVAPVTPAAPTADIAVVLAAVSAIAASGVVVFKKRH